MDASNIHTQDTDQAQGSQTQGRPKRRQPRDRSSVLSICPLECDQCSAREKYIQLALEEEQGLSLAQMAEKHGRIYQVVWIGLSKGRRLVKRLRELGWRF